MTGFIPFDKKVGDFLEGTLPDDIPTIEVVFPGSAPRGWFKAAREAQDDDT